MSVWTKICGLTRVDDALAAVDAGVDALGINFYPKSRRVCDVSTAADIVAAVGGRVLVYGLFVDLPRDAIERLMEQTGVAGVQLHGSEPAELSLGWSVPVLRSIPVRDKTTFEAGMRAVGPYDEAAPLRALLDNPSGGGSGRPFDTDVVAGADLSDAVVAGGLSPANVADVVSRLRPWGVDTASGVESRPGVKDAKLMKEFVENARSA